MIASPKTRLGRFIGRYRLFWNQCPRCNSDAPEAYGCAVCRDIIVGRKLMVLNTRQQYPPSRKTKAWWWHLWTHKNFEDVQRQWEKESKRAEETP